jgi:hypothetical protein
LGKAKAKKHNEKKIPKRDKNASFRQDERPDPYQYLEVPVWLQVVPR